MSKQSIGKLGEDIAVKFLLKNKFKIITRNYYERDGEIDIIAVDRKRTKVIFVEVKTRKSHDSGHPAEAVLAVLQTTNQN